MKHRGRGLAAIEYPTGMNQGGDPSQAWVKIKPDGRIDVFAGTVDLGQGSMPSTCALRVICSSIANDADVTPKPRMAVVGTWFDQTT